MDNVFALAQSVNISATYDSSEKLRSSGLELYEYMKANIHEIKNNGRNSFHIGCAFYFYRTVQEGSNESFERRFSNLVAYINLYEALAYGDMQSIIAAYRLHILFIRVYIE